MYPKIVSNFLTFDSFKSLQYVLINRFIRCNPTSIVSRFKSLEVSFQIKFHKNPLFCQSFEPFKPIQCQPIEQFVVRVWLSLKTQRLGQLLSRRLGLSRSLIIYTQRDSKIRSQKLVRNTRIWFCMRYKP